MIHAIHDIQMTTETAPDKLKKLQSGFAAHIRDPDSNAAPEGIEDRRMAIYRDLFFNNICSFLSSNFPVLKSLYNKTQWLDLCREFYKDHQCHTPLFPEIPREFLKYLQDGRRDNKIDPPFMLELAHYEWVELALSLDENQPDDINYDPDGDLLSGIPVLSPLAWPLSYRYPVHRIRADFQPQDAPDEATHLLVWRKADFTINFMQLNEISLRLLQKLKEEPNNTGLQLLSGISKEIQHPNPDVVIAGGKGLLAEFREKQIVLGIRETN